MFPSILPTLTYSIVFDDFDSTSIKELLTGIPTLGAIKLITDIEARLYVNMSSLEVQEFYYSIFLIICLIYSNLRCMKSEQISIDSISA